ncbi:Protein hob3 [Leucoagaricus sp. SymC.cos]|nr:Protein hob3 [Leucoagaricus sp. SymC.cos]
MSWAGFKKSVNRAGTTLLQKTGQIERTVDREFEDEESKYRVYEKECQALQKDSKAYCDAMRCASALLFVTKDIPISSAMISAQTRLAETVETFYSAADRSSEGAMAGHSYKRSVDDLDANFSRELDGPYRTTVLEPLGKKCAYFPVVNEHITKRNKKMLDYDSARSKLRKLIDKPSEDPTKLPQAQHEHDETKELFDLLNQQLIEELPQLLNLRVPYFDPTFEAMIRIQAKFAEEGYEKLSGVQRYFADNVRDDYAAGQLDAQVILHPLFYDSGVNNCTGGKCVARNARTIYLWWKLKFDDITCPP